MRPSRIALLIPLLGCLLQSASPYAEVFRWTDSEGHVHFTDRKPDSVQGVQQLDVPSAPVTPDPELQQQRERGRKLLEVWDAERAARDKTAAQAAAERSETERQCAWIDNELKMIARSRGLYREGEGGEREYLDAAERERYIGDLEQWRAQNCG